MAQIILGGVSTSSSFMDTSKNLPGSEARFKWQTIKNFVFLAEAFSSVGVNFDIFSDNAIPVPLYLYVIFTILLGMPYMCMDMFIKLYTGVADLQESLNPLLKGVQVGMMIQTMLWTVLNANDLADSITFFFLALKPIPSWLECPKNATGCVSTTAITQTCSKYISSNKTMDINITSSHYNYMKMFMSSDKTTRKVFMIAIVWISNFILCALSEQMVLKLARISFIFRNISTILALIAFSIVKIPSQKGHIFAALKIILKFDRHASVTMTAYTILYEFGIGLIGVYDFGTLSPFMIVDNAVVMFAITFIVTSIIRSTLVGALASLVRSCVKVKSPDPSGYITHHFVLFAIMPLGATFVRAERLLTMYLFLNLMISLCVHVCVVTYAISKILHSEFRHVKSVYLVGVICFIGFLVSVLTGWCVDQYVGYMKGLCNGMLILGILKTAIVMYLYGVRNFATDVQFWLGFKPTRYWIISWSLLPVYLMCITLRWAVKFFDEMERVGFNKIIAGAYMLTFIIILVLIIELRTIVKFILDNHLTGLLRSSPKYGPPDQDDRKSRGNYVDERQKECTHGCVPMDDRFDCNHMPIMYKPQFDEILETPNDDSITQVYEAGPSRKARVSVIMDAHPPQE